MLFLQVVKSYKWEIEQPTLECAEKHCDQYIKISWKKDGTVQIWLSCSRWYEASRLFHWRHISSSLMGDVLVATDGNWRKHTVDAMHDCISSLYEFWTDGTVCHRQQLKSALLTPSKVIWRRFVIHRWIFSWTTSPLNPLAAGAATFYSVLNLRKEFQWCSRTRWDTRWDFPPSTQSRKAGAWSRVVGRCTSRPVAHRSTFCISTTATVQPKVRKHRHISSLTIVGVDLIVFIYQNVILYNVFPCFKLSDEYMKLLITYRCGSRDSAKPCIDRHHFAALVIRHL